MHIHHSILDIETGQNIFSGPQGGETDAFFHFIAGLQNHMPVCISGDGPLCEQLSPICERPRGAHQFGMGA